MERKDFPVSTRIDEDLNKRLEAIIKETGKSRGEQVRIAIKRFVEISERLDTGESIAWLPHIEIDQCKRTLTELDEILSMKDDLKMSNMTETVINAVIDSLEWKLLTALHKKFPDKKTLFELR